MKKITLTLSIEEANTILEGLGQMPYKSVYHLINNIQQQAAQQAEEQISTNGQIKNTPPPKKSKSLIS